MTPQSGSPTESTYSAEWERAKRDERAYLASTGAVSVAGGDTLNLHLSNPTDGQTIHIENLSVPSHVEGSWVIYDSFTSAPSGGSDAIQSNMLMDESGATNEPTSGPMTASVDVSYTGDTKHDARPIPGGGGGGQSAGGEITNGDSPVIEPGREIVCDVTNETADTTGMMGIAIAYYTLDDVPSRDD